MPEQEENNILYVGSADAGQRLWRFLRLRLGLPRSLAQRWLRQGQLRVNTGRSKAERILLAGDAIRFPKRCLGSLTASSGIGPQKSMPPLLPPAGPRAPVSLTQLELGGALRIVYQDHELLALNKPAGLATQDGSGQKHSAASILRKACDEKACYTPAPAHRLDKPASGLLLAGKTHIMQSYLHSLFREAKGELERDYLCWAAGDFSLFLRSEGLAADIISAANVADIAWTIYSTAEYAGDAGAAGILLEDELPDLGRTPASGKNDAPGRIGRACYSLLARQVHPELGAISLLRVRLFTGRRHQIRLQLSMRGFALLGDRRYGGLDVPLLLLHAAHMRVPAGAYLGHSINERRLYCLPGWPPPFWPPPFQYPKGGEHVCI